MAPTKVPKKPLKLMEKLVDSPVMKSKKTKKRNNQNFGIYIYKILKMVAQTKNMRISRKSMSIMNSFVNDFLENIAVEAGRLVAHSKKNTLTLRDIQSAVKLVVPGELATHAVIDSVKAVNAYKKSFPENTSSP